VRSTLGDLTAQGAVPPVSYPVGCQARVSILPPQQRNGEGDLFVCVKLRLICPDVVTEKIDKGLPFRLRKTIEHGQGADKGDFG
jgi:hypothetical protein